MRSSCSENNYTFSVRKTKKGGGKIESDYLLPAIRRLFFHRTLSDTNVADKPEFFALREPEARIFESDAEMSKAAASESERRPLARDARRPTLKLAQRRRRGRQLMQPAGRLRRARSLCSDDARRSLAPPRIPRRVKYLPGRFVPFDAVPPLRMTERRKLGCILFSARKNHVSHVHFQFDLFSFRNRIKKCVIGYRRPTFGQKSQMNSISLLIAILLFV
jgi:hypothetical protein